jgi:hypothetical protein
MYLIDKTYFLKSISVPNTEEPTSDASTDLDMSIDRYARQFLQMSLGNVLFTDLDSYIIDGELDVLAPQKWLDLVNGVSYTKNGIDYVWQGLKYDLGLYKVSILAYYTYVNHYQNTVNSTLGQVGIDPKNGMIVNPTEHLVSVWNEFVEMYQGANCSNSVTSYYNGVLFTDYYQFKENGYVSYLQFLEDNKDVYEGFKANVINFKNSLGI